MSTFPAPTPITSVGAPFRDGFPGSALNPAKWLESNLAGGSIAVSAGTLTIGSGTTANAETWILALEPFKLPVRVSIGMLLSQRIANCDFFVELVSVNADTGLPDGLEQAALRFTGTSATIANRHVTTGGMTPETGTFTINTSATVGLFEIEASGGRVNFYSSAPLDSTSPRNTGARALAKTPNPDATYRLRLRMANGATPPASSTNAVITYLFAEDIQELSTEITGSRGSSSPNNAIAVQGTGTNQTVNVAPKGPVQAATGSITSVNSAATTNAALILGSATHLLAVCAHNTSASARYVRLYNKATAPVPGTDTPIIVIHLPPSSSKELEFGPMGIRFNLGIGYSITGGAPALDATAVAAGDVQLAVMTG